MSLPAQVPSKPISLQRVASLSAPHLRVDENTQSTSLIVRPLIGLSLCTNTASASIATRTSVGL